VAKSWYKLTNQGWNKSWHKFIVALRFLIDIIHVEKLGLNQVLLWRLIEGHCLKEKLQKQEEVSKDGGKASKAGMVS